MEIAAMAEGIFSPDPSPYLTEELEQHLDRLGQNEEEEDFLRDWLKTRANQPQSPPFLVSVRTGN